MTTLTFTELYTSADGRASFRDHPLDLAEGTPAARLSAQGSLAAAYFALREQDAEMALLDDIITGYERAATITGNRYRAGIAAHTDLLQAQSTLDNARATRFHAGIDDYVIAMDAYAFEQGEPQ